MAQSRVYSIPALIGLSSPLSPDHRMLFTWSPVGHPPPGAGLVSRDSASVILTNGLHFPRSPNLLKIRSSFPCSGVVWCVLNKPWPLTCIGFIMIIAGPHAGLISKFTCQQPSQETFITITDSRDYPVRSPSVSLSRASYCLCDARLLLVQSRAG